MYDPIMATLKRILAFDTDPSARRGLVHLLHAAGYDTRAFAHAHEFLSALGSEEFDCVLLDAGIPELPLDDLLAMLNECRSCQPFIVVTTHVDRETRRAAEKMRAVAFFRKPVDGVALLDAIEWAIRTHGTAAFSSGPSESDADNELKGVAR
jgi:FixJ family two-component response regulator